MERFGYPSLAAALAESCEILQLLELESFGDRALQIWDMEQRQMEIEAKAQQ